MWLHMGDDDHMRNDDPKPYDGDRYFNMTKFKYFKVSQVTGIREWNIMGYHEISTVTLGKFATRDAANDALKDLLSSKSPIVRLRPE